MHRNMPTVWSKYPSVPRMILASTRPWHVQHLDYVQGMPLTNPREEECENGHKWSEFIVLKYCSAKVMGERHSGPEGLDTI